MENTTPLIYKKIIEVMADINAIGKDRRNQQQAPEYSQPTLGDEFQEYIQF